MCLAIPARIVRIDPETETALVTLGGVNKEISLALVKDVAVDDYVLVHVGYALNKVSAAEADETLRLIAEIGLLAGEPAALEDDSPAGPRA